MWYYLFEVIVSIVEILVWAVHFSKAYLKFSSNFYHLKNVYCLMVGFYCYLYVYLILIVKAGDHSLYGEFKTLIALDFFKHSYLVALAILHCYECVYYWTAYIILSRDINSSLNSLFCLFVLYLIITFQKFVAKSYWNWHPVIFLNHLLWRTALLWSFVFSEPSFLFMRAVQKKVQP